MGGMGGMGQLNSFGRGGMGNMMGMGMMGGYGRNMYGGAGQQAGRTQQRRIRTHIRLGFSEPGIAPTVANNRVSKVFDRVLQREDFGGGQVNVAMDGTVAVLTGTVPTDHARDLLERLALLEPGISAVQNELTVSPDEPTPEK